MVSVGCIGGEGQLVMECKSVNSYWVMVEGFSNGGKLGFCL